VSGTFFRRLVAESPTRVWVNNPTAAEIGLALGQGAVGCTTNPAYGGGMLRPARAVGRRRVEPLDLLGQRLAGAGER